MKKIIFSILFIISSLFASESDWKFEEKWINDYDKALKLAKKEDKNIYLFIGADRCHFCKKFKITTLSNKEVMIKIKEDFIPLHLNRDHHFIPDKFEKFGAPRHYFLNSNGKIIYESAGAYGPACFLTIIDDFEIHSDD